MFNADFAVIVVLIPKWMAVIDDIVVIFPLSFYDRMVTGTRSNVRVLLKYLADTFERAQRAVSYGIGHTIVGTGPATF